MPAGTSPRSARDRDWWAAVAAGCLDARWRLQAANVHGRAGAARGCVAAGIFDSAMWRPGRNRPSGRRRRIDARRRKVASRSNNTLPKTFQDAESFAGIIAGHVQAAKYLVAVRLFVSTDLSRFTPLAALPAASPVLQSSMNGANSCRVILTNRKGQGISRNETCAGHKRRDRKSVV